MKWSLWFPAFIPAGIVGLSIVSWLIGNPLPLMAFIAAVTPGAIMLLDGCKRWGWGWWA